jgi:hypothetical protein
MSNMENEKRNETFTGILAGWDTAIEECYQLKHTLNTIGTSEAAYAADPDLQTLFERLYGILDINLPSDPSRGITKSNWKLRRKKKIGKKNPSLETRLEKRVIQLSEHEYSEAGPMKDWFNQMPAASGYWSPSSNKGNSIDLIHQTEPEKVYRFVELKVLRDSDKRDEPVYATFEILSYALLYLLTRANGTLREVFASALEPRQVLNAEKIHLIVLAPVTYFEKYSQYETELAQFERSVDAALRTFANKKVPGLEMSFEFRRFHNPVSTKEEIDAFVDFDPSPCGERLFPNH